MKKTVVDFAKLECPNGCKVKLFQAMYKEGMTPLNQYPEELVITCRACGQVIERRML